MTERKSKLTEGDTSDRELVMSRVFDAPIELIWKAFTDPKHVTNWWGPKGFTTETEVMDLKPGGIWKHTMIGPDGSRYPNKSVFIEIVKHERVHYSHGGGREGGPGASFEMIWTFKELGKNKTELTGRQIYKSKEDRDFVAKEFGAVEGGKQTLGRLADYLPLMPPDEAFVLARVFDAPRDLLFEVWTKPEHLKNWLAPKGFTVHYEKADVRPGGVTHYCMKGPNNMEMWGKATYKEITRPTLLTYVQCFSDKDGGITRHPMSPTWPLETLTTIQFQDLGNRSKIILSWLPVNANAEEMATFDRGRAGMNQGWGGTMEMLDQYLAGLKK